tara:strand:- start:1146 stop:1325 length:180 start_codon:yes stop_codon:yes gene_type:complete
MFDVDVLKHEELYDRALLMTGCATLAPPAISTTPFLTTPDLMRIKFDSADLNDSLRGAL